MFNVYHNSSYRLAFDKTMDDMEARDFRVLRENGWCMTERRTGVPMLTGAPQPSSSSVASIKLPHLEDIDIRRKAARCLVGSKLDLE